MRAKSKAVKGMIVAMVSAIRAGRDDACTLPLLRFYSTWVPRLRPYGGGVIPEDEIASRNETRHEILKTKVTKLLQGEDG